MDYSKFSDETLKKLQAGEELDLSKLTDDELEELNKVPLADSTPTPEPVKEAPSQLMSGVLGTAQGFSYGWSDEAEALARSLTGDKSYDDLLKDIRQRYEAAEEANPGTFLAGNVAGGALAPLPGGALVQGLKGGAKLGARLARGAGSSVVNVAGASEGDLDYGDLGAAATTGAALEGGMMGVGALGKTVAKGFKESRFGKDAIDSFSYARKDPSYLTPEGLEKTYAEAREAIETGVLPKISDDLQAAATKSYGEALEQGGSIAGDDMVEFATEFRDALSLKDLPKAFRKDKDIVVTRASLFNEMRKAFNPAPDAVPEISAKQLSDLSKKAGSLMDQFETNKFKSGNPHAYEMARRVKNAADQKLMQLVDLPAMNEQYATVSKVAGLSDIDLRGVGPADRSKKEKDAVTKLMAMLQESYEPGSQGQKMLTDTLETIKQSGLYSPDELADFDNAVKIAKDLSRKSELGTGSRVEAQLANATTLGGAAKRSIIQNLSTAALGTKFPGIVGRTVGKGERKVAQVTRSMYDATPEEIIRVADKIGDTSLARALRSAAAQPEKKRKAIMFTMMQSPAYRQVIEEVQWDDEETGE